MYSAGDPGALRPGPGGPAGGARTPAAVLCEIKNASNNKLQVAMADPEEPAGKPEGAAAGKARPRRQRRQKAEKAKEAEEAEEGAEAPAAPDAEVVGAGSAQGCLSCSQSRF